LTNAPASVVGLLPAPPWSAPTHTYGLIGRAAAHRNLFGGNAGPRLTRRAQAPPGQWEISPAHNSFRDSVLSAIGTLQPRVKVVPFPSRYAGETRPGRAGTLTNPRRARPARRQNRPGRAGTQAKPDQVGPAEAIATPRGAEFVAFLGGS
jgi:hypothetical protein